MSTAAPFMMVAAPSWRSRAYLQGMAAMGMLPSHVLLLPGPEGDASGLPRQVDVNDANGLPSWKFFPGTPVQETLDANAIPTTRLTEPDINHPSTIAHIQGRPEPVALYSGAAGALLRPPLLACGTRFLHVHGGYAPAYRGSTAFYYSMLRDHTLGATALWLEEAIDEGPILRRDSYPADEGLEIDRIQDPLVRCKTLLRVLTAVQTTGTWPPGEYPSKDEDAFTYYVIHPLLKHLILKDRGLCT